MALTSSAISLAAGLEVGDSLIVTFASAGQTDALEKGENGTFLGQTVSYNSVKAVSESDGQGVTSGLVNNHGEELSLSISWTSKNATGASIAQAGGRADKVTGQDYTEVFGDNIVTGDTKGSWIQGTTDTSLSLTISGLAKGQTYDLYMLTGRGNTWNSNSTSGASTSFYTLSGVTNLTASLVGASSSSSRVTDEGNLESYEYFSSATDGSLQWALVKWSFTANGDSVTISTQVPEGTTPARGNINAFAIQATASPAVPEPATATLSLLALAGVCARRRRR